MIITMLHMFNKICIVTLLLVTSLIIMNHDTVFASQRVGNGLYLTNNVKVEVNGEKVTFKDPILNKNGNIFLPMRNYFEMIGTSVSWNQQTKTASAFKSGNRVDVTLNSKTANVNGKKVAVNVPPFLYKNKTYVPIRFLSENLGGNVKWNQQAQKVEISINDEQKDCKDVITQLSAVRSAVDRTIGVIVTDNLVDCLSKEDIETLDKNAIVKQAVDLLVKSR